MVLFAEVRAHFGELGCDGARVGTCLGVSFGNPIIGLLLGVGIGMCFATAYGAFKDDAPEKKQDEKSEKDPKDNENN